jgi:hypothetical protein
MTHHYNEDRISLNSLHVIPIGKKILNIPRCFFTHTNVQILLKLGLPLRFLRDEIMQGFILLTLIKYWCNFIRVLHQNRLLPSKCANG